MKNKNLVYYASFFTYTIQGMIAISLGLLLPFMIKTYNIDYAQSGSFILFLLLGGVISSTIGGTLITKAGEKVLIIVGALCVIAGYGIILFVYNIRLIYFLLFVVGIGTGLFNIALNALITYVSNSDSKKISSLHMFFAVGALIASVLVGIITYYNLHWKIFLYIPILMSMIAILLFSRLSVERNNQQSSTKNIDFSFFKRPYIYILIALLFFYVGIESAINGWVVTFLSESGIVSSTASNSVLTVLWILVIVGRLINRRLKDSVKLESRILVSSFIILLSYIVLISTPSVVILIIAVVILGLAMSAFYPNVVANSQEKIKDNATALGLILSFGGLGGAIIPWINGIIADSQGLKVGMYAVIVSIIFLIIAATCNMFLNDKRIK